MYFSFNNLKYVYLFDLLRTFLSTLYSALMHPVHRKYWYNGSL